MTSEFTSTVIWRYDPLPTPWQIVTLAAAARTTGVGAMIAAATRTAAIEATWRAARRLPRSGMGQPTDETLESISGR